MTKPNALDAPTAIDGAIILDAEDDAAPPPEPTPRSVGGRYMIIEELGAGGMGRVDLAYDTKLHREVALKVLHPRVSSSVAARGRMLREAQAMAQLSHPNVVPIFDVEVDGEHLHIAMEYVRGQTMSAWLESDPSPEAIIEAFREAGRGLLAAHEAGLVHRDFKPNNVMMGDDGRARVMDFGLARGRDADPEAALPLLDEASALFEASLPPGHPYNAFVQGNRGWALIELGRHGEALAELEPALTLIHDSGIDALSEAQVRLLLGEALGHTGELGRARELMTEAKATIDELGATYWSERAQRWLDAQPPG